MFVPIISFLLIYFSHNVVGYIVTHLAKHGKIDLLYYEKELANFNGIIKYNECMIWIF